MAGEIIVPALLDFIEGKLQAQKQDEKFASLTKILVKEDGMIDWSKSAEEIERLIRAMNPWPIAFTHLGDKKLQIVKAGEITEINKFKIGEVFLFDKNKIAVQCGANSLILEKIKLEGKNEINAYSFSLGNKSFIGSILE